MLRGLVRLAIPVLTRWINSCLTCTTATPALLAHGCGQFRQETHQNRLTSQSSNMAMYVPPPHDWSEDRNQACTDVNKEHSEDPYDWDVEHTVEWLKRLPIDTEVLQVFEARFVSARIKGDILMRDMALDDLKGGDHALNCNHLSHDSHDRGLQRESANERRPL